MNNHEYMYSQISDVVTARTRFTMSSVKVLDCITSVVDGRYDVTYDVSFNIRKINGTGSLPGYVAKSSDIDSDVNSSINGEKSSFKSKLDRWKGNSIHSDDSPGKELFFQGPYYFGTSWTCGTCGGSGKVTCSTCGGHGEVTCHNCGGRGEVNCYHCGGRGYDTCSSCWGSGTIKYNTTDFNGMTVQKAANCSSCGGSGKKTCYSCGGGGKQRCNTCSGRGVVVCSRCGGSGYVTCSTCNGTGILHMYKSVECDIRSIRINSPLTQNAEHKSELNRLDFSLLKSLTEINQVSCGVEGMSFKRYYEYRALVTELKLEIDGVRFSIYGIGPRQKIFSFRHILDTLLNRDLNNIKKSRSGQKRFSLLPDKSLTGSLAVFLKSPVIAEIIENRCKSNPCRANTMSDSFFSDVVNTMGDSIKRSVMPGVIAGILPASILPILAWLVIISSNSSPDLWELIAFGLLASCIGMGLMITLSVSFISKQFDKVTWNSINKSRSFRHGIIKISLVTYVISGILALYPTVSIYNRFAFGDYYIKSEVMTFSKPDSSAFGNKIRKINSSKYFDQVFLEKKLYHKKFNMERSFEIPLKLYKVRLRPVNDYYEHSVWHGHILSEGDPGYDFISQKDVVVPGSDNYKEIEGNVLNGFITRNMAYFSEWMQKKPIASTIEIHHENVKLIVPMKVRLYSSVDLENSREFQPQFHRFQNDDRLVVSVKLVSKKGEREDAADVPVGLAEINAEKLYFYKKDLEDYDNAGKIMDSDTTVNIDSMADEKKEITLCYKYNGMYLKPGVGISRDSRDFKNRITAAKTVYRSKNSKLFKKFKWADK